MPFLPQRMRDMRILHRDTLEQVAEKLEISKQAVSKYESGKMIPSQNVLERLMALYDISADFLSKEMPEDIRQENMSVLYYCQSAKRRAKTEEYLDTLVKYAYEILRVCGIFSPVSTISLPIFANEKTIEEKALRLRQYWRLGMGPLPDLDAVLARFGIYTFAYDFMNEKLDGCARRIGENGIILLNNTKSTCERRQFHLSHELGHIVLNTMEEGSADAFAGAFLLPQPQISKEMLRTDADYILKVGNEWGVMPECLLERCRSLALLGDNQEKNFARYKNLKRQINALIRNKNTSAGEISDMDKELQIGKNVGKIWEDVSQRERFLEEMYIPLNFVTKLCCLPDTTFSSYLKGAGDAETEGAQFSFTFL